jgi:PAT family beta-lactamase induction signal transducer AmpG
MDIFRSKRWWILLTQFTMLATLAVIAFCLPLCSISVLMALFVVVAFASATHDIAADGYYMLALDQRRQSSFVGIRNTFYRGGLVLGQGLLVMLGGILQTRTGDIPKSWGYVLMISAVLLAFISVYHLFILPRPEEDTDKRIEG